MSIVLRPDPKPDPAASGGITETYERQNTLTDKLSQMSPFIYHELTGTNEIPKGFVYYHGGSKYECTADEAITGTPSNYIVFTQSLDGLTAIAAYISQATFASDYDWNDSYNGYYNDDGALCIPAEFEEAANGNITSPHLYVGRLGKVIGGRTNFSTGQGGTEGTAILQQIGYDIQSHLKVSRVSIHLDTDEEHTYIRRTTRAPSLTTSTQWWTILSISSGLDNCGMCRMSINVNIPSIGTWNGVIEVVSGGLENVSPIIRVISSSRNYALTNYQYEPQFRALYPATGDDTGIYIQIGLKSSGSETGSYVLLMNENLAADTTNLGFGLYISASGTAEGTPTYLPDGSTTPTAGGYVYGFSPKWLLLWTGNEEVDNGSYASTFFTGFTNQMFDQYVFLWSTGTGSDDVYPLLIPIKPISTSNTIAFGVTHASGDNNYGGIHDDPDSDDFSFTSVGGVNSYFLRHIYGAGK